MQLLSAYAVPSQSLVSELLVVSGLRAATFFEIFNFFLLSVTFFSIAFLLTLRNVHSVSNTNNDTSLAVWSIAGATASFILMVLDPVFINPSFFNIENLSTAAGLWSFADVVFVSLFLLITPLTLTLLVSEESLSIFFCLLNFIFLLVVVVFLSTTNNIIGLVLAYELVFVPSFFIMRSTVYSSSALSAYSVFTVWSVLGSLVVVAGAVYLVSILGYNAVSDEVDRITLSNAEISTVSLLFFLGFGVNIPVWPFHYWLTSVHVEASTGFSIFLSGFLVNAAVYVCWNAIVCLGISNINIFFTCICLYSVLDGVLNMPLQTDLNNLVAFATVFEMGLIYLFILWKPAQSCIYIYTFCFSHAFLSGLMFFLVDTVYTSTGTRSIDQLTGLVVYFPSISNAVWLFLFVFWGLPFTLKFFVELWVLITLIGISSTPLYLYVLAILFLSNVFVTNVWLQTLYGSPQCSNLQPDLSLWETLAVTYLVLMNTLSSVAFTYVFF